MHVSQVCTGLSITPHKNRSGHSKKGSVLYFKAQPY